jgi:hypothetical protein
MVSNILKKVVLEQIPVLVNKIIAEPKFFKNEIFASEDPSLPNPYFVTTIISKLFKDSPSTIFGQGNNDNTIVANIISSLMSLALACTHKNEANGVLPNKALMLIIKILATISSQPKNYANSIQSIMKNTLIDKLRE